METNQILFFLRLDLSQALTDQELSENFFGEIGKQFFPYLVEQMRSLIQSANASSGELSVVFQAIFQREQGLLEEEFKQEAEAIQRQIQVIDIHYLIILTHHLIQELRKTIGRIIVLALLKK